MFLEAYSVLTIKHQDKSAGIVFEYFHAGFEDFKTLWNPLLQSACEVVIF